MGFMYCDRQQEMLSSVPSTGATRARVERAAIHHDHAIVSAVQRFACNRLGKTSCYVCSHAAPPTNRPMFSFANARLSTGLAVNLTAFSQKWDITPNFAVAVSATTWVYLPCYPSPAHRGRCNGQT